MGGQSNNSLDVGSKPRMRVLIFALIVVGAAALGTMLVGLGTEAPDPQPKLISATDLRDNINSKADWYASFPRTTPAGIAMGCDIPMVAARKYNEELGRTFRAKTLASFRADCKG